MVAFSAGRAPRYRVHGLAATRRATYAALIGRKFPRSSIA